jgi:hypothetical protein
MLSADVRALDQRRQETHVEVVHALAVDDQATIAALDHTVHTGPKLTSTGGRCAARNLETRRPADLRGQLDHCQASRLMVLDIATARFEDATA